MEYKINDLEKLVRDGNYSELDKIRKEARAGQDAATYFKVCIVSGIEPEDPFLHERGEREVIGTSKKETSKIKHQKPDEIKFHDYSRFLDILSKRSYEHIRISDVYANTEEKIKILEGIFDYRAAKGFGSLRECPKQIVGLIFLNQYNLAKKYKEQGKL